MTRSEFKDLEAQIIFLKNQLLKLESLRNQSRDEIERLDFKILKDWRDSVEWEWSVKSSTFDKELKAMTIHRRIPESTCIEFELAYGIKVHEDDKRWVGMTYYRTAEKILDSKLGGHCILHTPMLCSDEEWAEICVGKIPNKFKK